MGKGAPYSKVQKLKVQLTGRKEREQSVKDKFFHTRVGLQKTRSDLNALKLTSTRKEEKSLVNKISKLNDNLLKLTDKISEISGSDEIDEAREKILELEEGVLSQMYRLQSLLTRKSGLVGSGSTSEKKIFIYGQESIGGNRSFFEPPDYDFFPDY